MFQEREKKKLNPDQKARDALIFKETPPEYQSGVADFYDIPGDVLLTLLRRNFADPDKTRDDGPSIKEFAYFVKLYPGLCTFTGYTRCTKPVSGEYGVVIYAIRMTGDFDKAAIIDFVQFSQKSSDPDVIPPRDRATRLTVTETELYATWY